VINVTILELAKTIPKKQTFDIIELISFLLLLTIKKELLKVIMPKIWLN
jgi:hypothetical protein